MKITNVITPINLVIKEAILILEDDYILLNDDPIEKPCSILRFINDCDADVIISFDGVDAHLFINSFTTYQFEPQKNKVFVNNVSQVPKYSYFWAKTVNALHKPIGYFFIAGYSSYK